MQPTEREMHGAQAAIPCLNGLGSRIRFEEQQQKPAQGSDVQQAGCESSHDDFFDQILFNLPWTDLSGENSKPGWELNPPDYPLAGLYDESTLLASRLKQNQITGSRLDLVSRPQGLLQVSVPTDSAVLPDGSPCPSAGDSMNHASIGLQQFHQTQAFNGGSTAAPPKQKVRARRGQATDPHSIAERLRRERIAERMKALQELVPNANKTDKASMLDEIIDYVKFLQLQVKVLSMSRLGGVAPFAANVSSKRENEGMTAAEQQVAKLMEEDMGAAMQYLQGKGLCLMPISLASVVSAATNSTISDISLSSANLHSS